MKVLIIGSGGREYSIGLALKKEDVELFFAKGNGATANLGQNIDYKNYNELVEFVKNEKIDLTIVGPEAPLVDGIVDIFDEHKLAIFGPSKKASQLEGSKIFMKKFLSKYNIPTASFKETNSIDEANSFIDTLSTPIVIKADGLCGGKGVIIAKSHKEAKEEAKEMLSGKSFGDAGKNILIEEFLDGYELSLFAICDKEDYIILPASQDHKRLLNSDEGPNTGGMGAYAPTPLINNDLYNEIEKEILKPTLKGMVEENMPFKGVLFMGIMVVNSKAYVLEYNVRFGDPECEVLMPLLKSSAKELFYNSAIGKLKETKVEFYNKYAVGVVMASGDYPYKSSPLAEIIIDEINDEKLKENSHIVYAGVTREDDTLYASGGRVLVCVGVGKSIEEAQQYAYLLVGQVHFANKQCRTDIAYQAIGV